MRIIFSEINFSFQINTKIQQFPELIQTHSYYFNKISAFHNTNKARVQVAGFDSVCKYAYIFLIAAEAAS